MKRLKRNPEVFEPIDLFSSIGLEYNYNLQNPDDRNDFIQKVSDSLVSAKDTPRVLFGKRVESSFPIVLGALGKVLFIKQEDSGASFSTNKSIKLPDYRVTIESGEQYLVEVKNCHSENLHYEYPFRNDYLDQLQTYADMNKVPLKLAIYYSKYNQWVLLDPTSLIKQPRRYVTDFINSMAKNEMGLFGDVLLGAKPNLEFIIVNDLEKASPIAEDGQTLFVIKDIKLKCDGVEIKEEIDKKIAFYLTRYGDWIESSVTPLVVDNKVESITFIFEPENEPDNKGFEFIGYLSSMISTAYREHTIIDGKVVSIDANVDPVLFNIGIPDDHKSDELPLWRFNIQPNFETEVKLLSSKIEG